MIWLNSDPSSSSTYTILDYAIYYYRAWSAATNKRIYIYENWINRGQYGTRINWDVLRVERSWTTIEYKKNGVVFYTSTVVSPSSITYFADTSLYDSQSAISNVAIHWPVCQKCWNWIIEWTETCDDFNTGDSDGCSSQCETENNYFCVWEPSSCQTQLCSAGTQIDFVQSEHWISQSNISISSPDRALWTPNSLWAYMNAENDQLDIEMTETVPAWMSFQVYLADQTASFYYQWYTEVHISWDGWSTYTYITNFEPATLYPNFASFSFNSPIDTTHVRLINRSHNIRRWWRMYVDAVVADTYTCCGDSLLSRYEYCDDWNSIGDDWCSEICQIEESYSCLWEPSICNLFCANTESYSEYSQYMHWDSQTNIWVWSANNALWSPNNSVATIDGRQWDEITIQLSNIASAWQEISTFFRVYSPASWRYEQDIDVYFSSDWWSTFTYTTNIIGTSVISEISLNLPLDVTHIKYVPTAIPTYWTIMYLDAVVANDFSCCADGNKHPEEQCDEWWETNTCTAMCLFPVCWDKQINWFEECDDGNTVWWDLCSAECDIEYCRDDAPLNDTSKNLAITSLSPSAIWWTSTQPNSEVAICLEDTTGTRDIFYTTTDASWWFSYTPNLSPYAAPRVNVWVMLHNEDWLDIDHHALMLNN